MRLHLRVRYHEVDQMGIVYHPRYLTWFESCRMSLLRGIGHPYDRLEREGLRLPVIGAEVDYPRPLGFGDEVVVEATLEGLSGARFQLAYRVLRGGAVHTRGRTRHAAVSAATGRATRIPAELAAALRELPSQGGTRGPLEDRDPLEAGLAP